MSIPRSTVGQRIRISGQRARAILGATLLGAMLLGVSIGAGQAMAAPTEPTTPQSPTADTATESEGQQAGVPMSVPAGSFGYLATHDMTQRMASMGVARAVAGLPVPGQLRNANLGFAQQLDLAIKGALDGQRGCLQMIANPSSTPGNIFDYGFYAVSEAYCP